MLIEIVLMLQNVTEELDVPVPAGLEDVLQRKALGVLLDFLGHRDLEVCRGIQGLRDCLARKATKECPESRVHAVPREIVERWGCLVSLVLTGTLVVWAHPACLVDMVKTAAMGLM